MWYEEESRRLLALTVAFVALCAGVSSGQGIDTDISAKAACTETLQERYFDAAEARSLDETGGRVVRDGCTLRFRARNGGHSVTSNLSEDADHVRYVYRGVLPHEYDVVEVSYYESRRYLVIDRTGLQKHYVVGEPIVSPDRQRIVATSQDLVRAVDPNALEIWRLEDRFARLELSIQSDEWAPSDATWIDAATIAFVQNFLEPVGGDRQETARLRLTPSGWSLELGVTSGPFGGR